MNFDLATITRLRNSHWFGSNPARCAGHRDHVLTKTGAAAFDTNVFIAVAASAVRSEQIADANIVPLVFDDRGYP